MLGIIVYHGQKNLQHFKVTVVHYLMRIIYNNLAGALPTYGVLIDMFEEFGSDQHLLCAEISKQFPSIRLSVLAVLSI